MRQIKIQDEESITQICRDYQTGRSMQEIGDEYFVSADTIGRILKRNKIAIRKKTITPAVRAHNWEISLKQKGRLRGPYGHRHLPS